MGQPRASITMGDHGVVRCEGPWTVGYLAAVEQRLAAFAWPDVAELVWDASDITEMDTGGAVLLQHALNGPREKGKKVSLQGLRAEFAELLELVSKSLETIGPPAAAVKPAWLERIGFFTWHQLRQTFTALAFLGESTSAVFWLLHSPRSVRWRALFASLQIDGFNALPITGLLTFLMGVVIAYQGAEQLRTFGANIFVVDLVGISLLREIAPLVTAILVAGRSGSAYAAQIGTMKVTEELDAIRTLGISPMQLLVLPKLLALVVALPLLTVYADVVGVFGGMLIAWSQLGVNFSEFLSRFEKAIALRHFLIGVAKAPVFAVIIALVGCYQGFQIRGGVDDIGRHTTISVVQAIFFVIVFDAFFSVLLSWWRL